jgi:hypothetical protein
MEEGIVSERKRSVDPSMCDRMFERGHGQAVPASPPPDHDSTMDIGCNMKIVSGPFHRQGGSTWYRAPVQSLPSCRPNPLMAYTDTSAGKGAVHSPTIGDSFNARLGWSTARGRWGERGGLVACIFLQSLSKLSPPLFSFQSPSSGNSLGHSIRSAPLPFSPRPPFTTGPKHFFLPDFPARRQPKTEGANDTGRGGYLSGDRSAKFEN